MMRGIHPCLFHEVDAPKRVIGLHSGSMEGFLHSCVQSPLYDVSFPGDIAPRRPLDQQNKVNSSHDEALPIHFRELDILGGLDVVLRVLGRLKEERNSLSTSSTPTHISVSALWQEKQGKDSSLSTPTFGMGAIHAHDSWEELLQYSLFSLRIE